MRGVRTEKTRATATHPQRSKQFYLLFLLMNVRKIIENCVKVNAESCVDPKCIKRALVLLRDIDLKLFLSISDINIGGKTHGKFSVI